MMRRQHDGDRPIQMRDALLELMAAIEEWRTRARAMPDDSLQIPKFEDSYPYSENPRQHFNR